ncbi:MAG: lipopolysaccharide heptosyltransferase I [Campylobacter sp.]|nr:lipopolysaccharide heptosyltransferase I [Campylobacter sp.]
MKIAIIRLSALGDIIQTSVVLQFIKKNVENAEIYWVCDEKFAKILENLPNLNGIIKIPLKDKKIAKSYQILKEFSGKFDLILDFQGLIKSAIVARILGKNTFGFDKFSIRESFAANFYKDKIYCEYGENTIIRYLTLASKALDFKFDENEILNKQKCFSTKPTNLKFANAKNVLIAPFASEPSKCYDKFKQVINGLNAEKIYICHGNENEKKRAELIAGCANAEVLPSLSINEMIGVVENMNLVIGNDSAITHLAWAQNVPSITLFGNRPSWRNAYKTPINLVIDTGKKIDPKKIDKNDFCINEIPPQAIISKANELLNG